MIIVLKNFMIFKLIIIYLFVFFRRMRIADSDEYSLGTELVHNTNKESKSSATVSYQRSLGNGVVGWDVLFEESTAVNPPLERPLLFYGHFAAKSWPLERYSTVLV